MKVPEEWRKIVRAGQPGFLYMTPEDVDDIWALSNIIEAGDVLQAPTFRKVLHENSQGTVVDSQRVRVVLAVGVEKVDVDLQVGSLRVNGKNQRENPHVKLGAYHTMDVIPDLEFRLEKPCWDSIHLEWLEQAITGQSKQEVALILVQEGAGLAWICLHSPQRGTKQVRRVEQKLGKLAGTSKADAAMAKFEEAIRQGMAELQPATHRAILLVSQTTEWATSFIQPFLESARSKKPESNSSNKKEKEVDFTPWWEHRSKILRLQHSSPHPNVISELLNDPRCANALAECKLEERLMSQIHGQLDEGRAVYGLQPTLRAADLGAIQHLLIADTLVRSEMLSERRQFSQLIKQVRDGQGRVHIVPAHSAALPELAKLGNIAALLTFPLFDE